MDKERIIQEFVPGKQVTLAHLIAHPGEELAKKIGVPDAGAIGIMTLTPGETAMIAGDLALKAADVHIGFLDRFSGALVIYGSVGAVEEALSQTVSGLGRLLNYTLCEIDTHCERPKLTKAFMYEKPQQQRLMRCRGIIPSQEKHRPWNLMIMAILIHRVNILAIPAGITP